MSKHLADDDSNFGERFIHEARTVARLSQQNIVNVFDVGVYDGYNYIAMELLPGTTLDDKIKEGLSHADALSILKQMAAALNYAHQKGIIHRDVKPENIMFREDGSVVLTDFGIAKSTTATNKMTATGTVIGTPHYMSPEQAQGIEIGPFADIYSLGVVFYEMLKGEVPYDADSTIAVAFKHITEPVPELGEDLQEYQFLLNGMMAKDLDERYHSGQDIIDDINTLERNETPDNATKVFRKTAINKAATQLNRAAKKQSQKPKQEEKKSKTPLFAGIAASLILAIGAGGYVYNDNQNEDQRATASHTGRKTKTGTPES
jgi:serine/threonine-protein kinase PpkA